MYTGMVMIDLQKTFDSFDHQFVDKKVQCLGVSGIKQFKTCLAGGKQSIDVHGAKYSLSDVEYHRRVSRGLLLYFYYFQMTVNYFIGEFTSQKWTKNWNHIVNGSPTEKH